MSKCENKYCLIKQTTNNTQISISKAEYEKISATKKKLLEMLFLEEEFDIVLENFYEYEMELIKFSMNNMMFENYNRFANERGSINRRIMNILSSCRSYMDGGSHHISNIDKSINEQVKSNKSKECSVFGYKVMTEIRNHAQHRGLPIHSYTHNHDWVNKEKLRFSITPYIHVKQLKEDKSFNASVLKELVEEKYNVKPLLREYISSISKIHQKSRDLLKQNIGECDELFYSTIEKFKKDSNSKDAVGLAAAICENGNYKDPISIFTYPIERRKELEQKNKCLDLLSFRYVSSE